MARLVAPGLGMGRKALSAIDSQPFGSPGLQGRAEIGIYLFVI